MWGATRADLEIIASSRADVPLLIAEIRRLRALGGRLHDGFDRPPAR